MFNGLLPVDKPCGMTSHDVVDAVRRITGVQKVGHTGTLDPDATGVLLVCVGKATRFVRFFEGLMKTYWTVIHLGICTDTQDASGTIIERVSVPSLSSSHLQEVLAQFTGTIQQIPPMYSAVKYHGQRLYHYARRGQTVSREPREVYIYRLELFDVRDDRITIAVQCSKGTYIRALGEDIGRTLGYGGHVEYLQRCGVGTFTLSNAYSLEFLQKCTGEGTLERIFIPIAKALEFLPALSITSDQFCTLRKQGREVSMILNALFSDSCQQANAYRLRVQQDKTVAVVQRQQSDHAAWQLLAVE